jgi:hypothetical protein
VNALNASPMKKNKDTTLFEEEITMVTEELVDNSTLLESKNNYGNSIVKDNNSNGVHSSKLSIDPDDEI